MAGIEWIGRSKEKNILKGMFQGSDDDSDISCFSDEEDKLVHDVAELEISDAADVGVKYIEFESPIRHICVKLESNPVLGIAFQLWPAARLLCDFIESHPEEVFEGHEHVNLLELGAGIGLCGIFSQLAFSERVVETIVTDLADAVPLMDRNIAINEAINVHSAVLPWGSESDLASSINSFTSPQLPCVVLAADCVYWENLFQPLCDTVTSLCKRHYTIIIAHVRRWKKDGKFFQMCKKNNLKVVTLIENVSTCQNENTGQISRLVTRIYKISLAN